ncbi:MAG: class I SAM-dependent methyltransferase [Pseudomonadota bacterium]
MPTAEDFERIYARSEYHDVHYAELESGQFRRSLAALARFVPAGARVLDFGCGNGEFLTEALAAGYVAEGVELDQAARDSAAANSGCTVFSPEDVRTRAGGYDAIHLGDVLEHLPDPAATLRELDPLLAPSGLFLVEGPLEENRSLVAWTAACVRQLKARAGRSNYAIAPPTHLTRTSAQSQRSFFERVMGYRVAYFNVYESGWPYAVPWRRIIPLRPPSTAVRGLIGKAAIGLAGTVNVAGLRVGDRFIALLQPAGK